VEVSGLQLPGSENIMIFSKISKISDFFDIFDIFDIYRACAHGSDCICCCAVTVTAGTV